jgi:Tfp pilus assembly protein PilV
MSAASHFWVSLLLLLIGILTIVLLQPYLGRKSAEGYWQAEQEMQARRLFGDAWKEAL